MKYTLLLLFALGCISSCSIPAENEKPVFQINYLALMDKEIAILEDNKSEISKTIYYNRTRESKNFRHPDWRTELRPFLACNVQTPATDKLYSVFNRNSGDSLIISYIAKEENLEIRSLEIILIKNKFEGAKAILFKKNSYFTLRESLHYTSLRGYTISGAQKMMLAAETIYRVQAQFVKPS